jgi:hypothetical protein
MRSVLAAAREQIVACWRLVSAPAPGHPDPAASPPIVWPPAPLPER